MAKTKSKTAKGKAPASRAKAPAAVPGIDIGISTSDRKQIAAGLASFLSDSFTLYLRTHNFHWNVTGPMFNTLHTMFETQYTEQWTALDEIAERIRALGFAAPASYADFARLSSIKDGPAVDGGDWRAMVQQLVSGNEAVCRTAREVLEIADDADDADGWQLRLFGIDDVLRVSRRQLPQVRALLANKPGAQRSSVA